MKQRDHDDFELFFQELPPSDYLDDIEIDDGEDEAGGDVTRGLSEEQVSAIARDSLGQGSNAFSPLTQFETIETRFDADSR